MTLLEVVLAVVILSLVTTAIVSSITFALRVETLNQQKIAAHEVGSRLVLQFLDDAEDFASIGGRPIEYGPSRYGWSLEVEPVQLGFNEVHALRRSQTQSRDAPRTGLITCRVWLLNENDLIRSGSPGDHLAEITRLYVPSAMRNKDQIERMLRDQRIGDIYNRFGAGGSVNEQFGSYASEFRDDPR